MMTDVSQPQPQPAPAYLSRVYRTILRQPVRFGASLGFFDQDFRDRIADAVMRIAKIVLAPIYFIDRGLASSAALRVVRGIAPAFCLATVALIFYVVATGAIFPEHSKESAFAVYAITAWILALGLVSLGGAST